MKKFFSITAIVLVITLLPLNVFAKNGLPENKLPDMDSLKVPELSKDYNKLLKELQKQGFGKFEHDPDKKIELPKAKTPEGTGKDGVEKFKEEYGDMKNDPNRQLDKSSVIPHDEFFDEIYKYGDKNKENFNKIRDANREKMDELMKKQLDKSFLWDLENIKDKFKKRFLTDAELAAFLDGTPKPDGWGDIKNKSFVVPTMPKLTMRPISEVPILPFTKPGASKSGTSGQTPGGPGPQPQAQAQPQPQAQTQAQRSPSTGNVYTPSTAPGTTSPAPGTIPVPGTGPAPVPGRNENRDTARNPGFNPTPAPAPAMAKESLWDKTKNVASTVGSAVKKGAAWAGEKTVAAGRAIVDDVKANPWRYVGAAIVAASCVVTGGAAAPLAAGGGALALLGV